MVRRASWATSAPAVKAINLKCRGHGIVPAGERVLPAISVTTAARRRGLSREEEYCERFDRAGAAVAVVSIQHCGLYRAVCENGVVLAGLWFRRVCPAVPAVFIFRTPDAASGNAKSRFYGFPIARIGAIYLAVQLIINFIEMALAKVLSAWVPLVVNLILLFVTIIGCMTVETMRDEIVRQDDALKRKASAMRELQFLSSSLVGQCSDEMLKLVLQKLTDEFRYSDIVSYEETQEIEEDMKSQQGDIQQVLVEGDTEGTKSLCG